MAGMAFSLFATRLPAADVDVQPWGRTADGQPVQLYTLRSGRLEAAITDYGGRIVRLLVPDRNDRSTDVVLGFDRIDGYLGRNPNFGGIIGRHANRIAGGRFKIGAHDYQLPLNDGRNTLHSGDDSYDRRVWSSRIDNGGLLLQYVSADGDQGFPGTLTATVRYTLTDHGLRIDYAASSDTETAVDLTNHAYFNLAGHGGGSVLDHELALLADRYTPVREDMIPTGELRSVAGTAFDFRRQRRIGERIDEARDQQLAFAQGYDHNWVLRSRSGVLALAASLYEPRGGRVLEVLTTEPGLQLYTGNFLGDIEGKDGAVYARRSGLCLETQHFPDSPNQADFPSTLLKPGRTYRSTTMYRFSTRAAEVLRKG